MPEFFNGYIVAAFVVASLAASYKVQWQSFFYLLVVIYAVQDALQFAFVSGLFVVVVAFHQFRGGVSR